jgi:hypothetical protein
MSKLEEIEKRCRENARMSLGVRDVEELKIKLHLLKNAIENVRLVDKVSGITETMKMANYAMTFVGVIEKLYKSLEDL